MIRGIHGSVFIKKITKPNLKKKTKPNRNRFKPTGFGSVWFFRAKTGSNRFGSGFSVWLGFFWFGSVFSIWLCFFWIFSVRVRFGSVFLVTGLKNRNQTEPVGFFKILISLIGFFSRFGFFGYFFLVFSV